MNELKIERTFLQTPEEVFAFVTQAEHLLAWWGPENMTLSDHQLDFTRTGAWFSVLINAQGGRHKMSGEVVAVDPPRSVEFTWGWHDDGDNRGDESTVRFEISPNDAGGSRFTLIHSNLPSADSAESHNQGWASVMRKLESFINTGHS